ncbi:MAG: DUF2272 domain-containing protein [Alphaproteobacteria bacterium]|nr:DUF2272 domain-containing protein [Alphaproteobacteria bacterium]
MRWIAMLAGVGMMAGCAAAPAPTAFQAPFARAGYGPERIARIAEREWLAFGSVLADGTTSSSGRRETEDGWWQRVGDYWFQGVGAAHTGLHETADGRPFWSAAFISYVMAAAGAGDRFVYSDAHAVYINRAIADREAGRTTGWLGWPIDALTPQRGDLVCQARAEAGRVPVRYHTRPARFPAHCDIVVAVEPDWIAVIGGNVADTVARRRYPLHQGRLPTERGDWLALLRFQG